MVPGVGRGSAPLTCGSPRGAAGHVKHGALEPDEEPQQLGEPGPVERAGCAVRRGMKGQRVADARHGDLALALQLPGEHGARRPPRRQVSERPRDDAGRESRDAGQPAHRAPGGTATGVGEHQVGVGATPHEAQQRLDVRRVGVRITPNHSFVFTELYGDGPGEAEALGEELFGELRQPVLDWCVEVLDRLEDGEWYDTMDHGARNLACPGPIAKPGRVERGYGTL